MKVLLVTGYKPMEINIFQPDDERINIIKAAIEQRLIGLIDEGLEWVLISGKRGVEQWAGEVALNLRDQYGLKLALIPPFEHQDGRWPESIQELYQGLMASADFYKPLYQGDYRGPYQYQASNKWLVAKSDSCLMLLDEDFQGSNQYIYQEIQTYEGDYPLYQITPADLEDIKDDEQMTDPDYWQ
ncbi:DUF1273 domain-containing protein [Barrientosiimonas marina]|uniref:SLOG family protein n=1 Tax=Lentibacillus kimchii TaxID=1542911 RepID=A0ABW2UW68_9BACI